MADVAREDLVCAFLAEAGWDDAVRVPLAGDASTRSYVRLEGARGRAVLMNAPPAKEEPACPPNADEAARLALGYNAVARLAGPDTRPFAAISNFLNTNGLSAPKIILANYEHGLLLIEDLGDAVYTRIIRNGMEEAPLYEAAVDALAAHHQRRAPTHLTAPRGGNVPLLEYDELALCSEVRLLTEWYLPACSERAVSPELEAEYLGLWEETLRFLGPGDDILVLRDYHADNLLWLPEREGIARVGILDFQDGLKGHRAYDLVSLLEDARRDVSPVLAERMVAHYASRVMSTSHDFDLEQFGLAYALLGLQRNTKILGIFARLWKRDGKPQYPSYMPRVWAHVEHSLAHPAAANLKAWYDRHIPQIWRGGYLAAKAEAGE